MSIIVCLSSLITAVRSEPLIMELSKTEQFMTILKSMKAAALMSFTFFKFIFSITYKSSRIMLSPIVWIISFSWNNLILKPLDLLLSINRTLYPITMFCLAAVCCGLFIGGCAGFAAEAFSSIVITATWGPQPKQIKEQEEEEEEKVDESEIGSVVSLSDYPKEDKKETESTKSDTWDSSATSSQSFSMYHQLNNRKGKESVTTARQLSPPVLIRRMKLSPTPSHSKETNTRKNSWDWEEEEDHDQEQREGKKYL